MKRAVHIVYLISLLAIIFFAVLSAMTILSKILGAGYSWAVACLPVYGLIISAGVASAARIGIGLYEED